jgi:L-threonylcarbamoyladenylate synthase
MDTEEITMADFDTDIIRIDPQLIEENNAEALARDPGIRKGAELIKEGQLVAFPTETVYGLGADASSEEAAQKIYQAKGRPPDNPLIVHIASMQQLDDIIKGELNNVSRKLIETFWPGPLTLLFEKNDTIPDSTTAGLASVAVRMPGHPVTRALIELAGLPIAAPSANTSGAPSPTRAGHVMHDLKGKIPLILDGGPTQFGVESTVVDVRNGTLRILRPGGVSREAIEELVLHEAGGSHPGHRKSDRGMKGRTAENGPADRTDSAAEGPLSPGMKYRHYSPDTPLFILKDERELRQVIDRCAAEKLGFVITDETYSKYSNALRDCTVITMGPGERPEIIAAQLFDILRRLDELSLDAVYIEFVSESGIGAAVMNRLYKAAGKGHGG